jgi:hypothetical protein
LLCFLSSSIFFSGVHAQNGSIITSQTENDIGVNINQFNGYAQSFTIGSQASKLTAISILISNPDGATSGSLNLKCYYDDVFDSTGGFKTLTTSNSIDVSTIGATATWVTFLFPSVFGAYTSLTPSTLYSFAVFDTITSNNIVWYENNHPTFTSGSRSLYEVGTAWVGTSQSMCFVAYDNTVTVTPTPTPNYQNPTPTPTPNYQNPTPTPTPNYQNPTPTPTPNYQNPTPTPYNYNNPTPTPYTFPTPTQPPTYILGYGFSSTDLMIILLATVTIMGCGVYVAHAINSSNKSKRKHK